MLKTDKLIRCYVVFQLLVLTMFVGSIQAEGLQARYLENSGTKSVLEIRIEDPPPSSVIVKQNLPPNQNIDSTLPAYTKYNPQKNVMTWLIKRPVPGVQKIITHYTNALSGAGASAVIRCKSPRDGSLMTIHVE